MKTKSRVNVGSVTLKTACLRHRKVLMTVLKANCQQYKWFPEVLSHLTHHRWDKLYHWSDCASEDSYSTAAEHFAANQISALIRKYPRHYKEYGLSQDPRSVAVEKFLAAERLCRVTNKRFRTLRGRSSSYRRYLDYMKDWIEKVLGPLDIDSINSKCGFSSGACVGVHGNATNLFRKMYAESWTVSPMARDPALRAIASQPQLLHSFMESRNGVICYDTAKAYEHMASKCKDTRFNKVSFVPKTAKTHRSIAVEPLLNSFLQKGIDSYMRERLRMYGYDLSNQAKNSFLAKVGSTYGELATVDLSSASDTVSAELVRYLLPIEWVDFLDRARSTSYLLDGKTYRYEKYASMGNGFCFPLETLIFAACVQASLRFCPRANKTNSVYGDDIIIASSAYPLLRRILRYCGFRTNDSKTFPKGPFRESCGADWYLGQDVRPVYMDYHLSDDIRLMIFHNATYRSKIVEDFFIEVRELLLSWVPHHRRMLRPRERVRYVPLSSDYEVQVLYNGAFSVDMDTFMCGKWTRWLKDRQIWSWREVHSTPFIDEIYACPQVERAQYLSFLRGSPSGKLTLRRKVKLSYKIIM